MELVQEAGAERQPGFLIYLSVFAPADPHDAAEVLGYVYAPFRAGDLLGSTLAGMQLPPIEVEDDPRFERDGADLVTRVHDANFTYLHDTYFTGVNARRTVADGYAIVSAVVKSTQGLSA